MTDEEQRNLREDLESALEVAYKQNRKSFDAFYRGVLLQVRNDPELQQELAQYLGVDLRSPAPERLEDLQRKLRVEYSRQRKNESSRRTGAEADRQQAFLSDITRMALGLDTAMRDRIEESESLNQAARRHVPSVPRLEEARRFSSEEQAQKKADWANWGYGERPWKAKEVDGEWVVTRKHRHYDSSPKEPMEDLYVAMTDGQKAKRAVSQGRFSQALHQMAYPQSFSMDRLKGIRSYAGRLRYVESLLGKAIGTGSSRKVYKVDDEKVLKVALNKKGLDQNRTESDWGLQNSSLVAKVFDTDDDGIFIEMELADTRVSQARFKELAGLSLGSLDRALRAESLRLKPDRNIQEDRAARELAQELWETSEFFQELMDIAVNFSMPIPGDFTRLSSWGVVQRGGSESLVLIDFGLNEDTYKTHYSPARKKAGY